MIKKLKSMFVLLVVLPIVANAGELKLIVSVDWEGYDLKEKNLIAMNDFRNEFPEVKLLHYLNAAYFTKPSFNPNQQATKIRKVLRKGDELGLHIHGWRSLFEAAGVKHLKTNRWTPLNYKFPYDRCSEDCGHEIPISNYSKESLSSVIAHSVNLLEMHGFGRAKSFRAGGWMSNDNVRAALVENGFTSDSSAVPVDLMRDDLWQPGVKEYQLIPMLDQLWKGSYSTTSQPFYQNTSSGQIIQIPDNASLADYMTGNEMWQVVLDNYSAMQNDPQSNDRYIMLGFHQESAMKYLPRIEKILTFVRENRNRDMKVSYAKLPIFQ